jgi:hypothetical protein
MTKYEIIFCEFQKGRAGFFYTSLITAMFHASDNNLYELAKAYPELCDIIKKFRTEPGYSEKLLSEYNNSRENFDKK